MLFRCYPLLLVAVAGFAWSGPVAAEEYSDIILGDKPLAYWRMNGPHEGVEQDVSGNALDAAETGRIAGTQQGPQPPEYPDFSGDNKAVRIARSGGYLVVTDPGDDSELDFTVGDAITMEAWVRMDQPVTGGYPYILSKGRTHNPGFSHRNQNYSLRLAPNSNGVCISFFFVDSETATEGDGIGKEGHRWTSTIGIPDDGGWHHVAVTYEFGQERSLHGYIDGEEVPGKWDMGGATSKAPVVDNDELWIGSAMAGHSGLGALLDEVALYRRALSKKQIQKHVTIHYESSGLALGKVDPAAVPDDHVRVEIMERVPVGRSWKFRLVPMQLLYETDLFALKQLPPKYNAKGLIDDRPIPSLIHLCSTINLPAGEYELILRSLDAARLYVDGQLLAETDFLNLRSDAHQEYYELPEYGPEMLSIAGGHQQQRVKVTLEEGEHLFSLYRLVGNKGHGSHLGEMVVGIAKVGGRFHFLSPQRNLPFTDAGWLTFLAEDRVRLRDWNQRVRMQASEKERAYWKQRHAWARQAAGPEIPLPSTGGPEASRSPIDRLIAAHLDEVSVEPMPLVDDWTFLRRVCLDTVGTIPAPELIDRFFAYPVESRRERIVDDLIASPGWADHWVGYWQDVLAENPGLTKPELNNSGPFRWYLYESLLDNKPLDRFATELVMMEGSAYSGGPAGFGIATQNDVPLAAKAHILGTAFLAVEMKCARCHDAPYHDVQQGDLFSLAAMLKRGEQKVPGSSTVPLSPEELEKMMVKVTLPPGSSVKPNWPFVEFVSQKAAEEPSALPHELVRNEKDTRERLAAMLTSPKNTRFARVIVNRVWKRYMGRGLVEPVDDWEDPSASYPELVDYLARELVVSGYDLKHLARLILTSQTYQRQCVPDVTVNSEEAALFRGPVRRKMTGEQLADSLYLAVGKPFRSEELTMDGDGKRDEKSFGHFGIPRRGWQFVAVSNERDRPSMTLPVAQSIVDLMSAFGWRQQRQDPLTVREDPLTALQPMALANGTAALRAVDFTDRSALTKLAIDAPTVESFIDGLYERLLTRSPSSDERLLIAEILAPGFEGRVIAGPEAVPPQRIFRSGVTWSNHFDPKSDVEAIERQREVIAGEPPSVRLDPDWRKRAEDVAWSLVNSPEFVFVP